MPLLQAINKNKNNRRVPTTLCGLRPPSGQLLRLLYYNIFVHALARVYLLCAGSSCRFMVNALACRVSYFRDNFYANFFRPPRSPLAEVYVKQKKKKKKTHLFRMCLLKIFTTSRTVKFTATFESSADRLSPTVSERPKRTGTTRAVTATRSKSKKKTSDVE